MFGLSFLNPLLLLGTLASLIPLLIHFLSKKEPVPQVFSTLRFLKEAAETVQRRWRVRNFLLLLVRMLIIALLAFLFARPAITRSTLTRVRNIALIIDNSPSMAFHSNEESRFSEARKVAVKILRDLDESSRALVAPLLTGDKSSLVFRRNSEELVRDINDLRLGRSAGNFFELLSLVTRQANQQNVQLEKIYFITDRQQSVFNQVKPELGKTTVPISVILAGEEHYRNAAVLGLRSRSPFHFEGAPESFSLELGAWSSDSVSQANVLAVSVNGEKKIQTPISLDQSKTTRNFSYTFTRPGQRLITIELDDDGLKEDNKFSRLIEVSPRPRVLLVSEKDDLSAKRAAFYLKGALTTSFADQERLVDLMLIPPEKLASHNLLSFNLVIYAGLRQLTRSARIMLEDFVSAGGSLLLLPDENIDLTIINNELSGANRRYRGLLPAKLASRTKPPKPLKLQVENWKHPLFQSVSEARETIFKTASYYEYLALGTDFSDDVTILARYSDQAPAILMKKFGEGRVVFSTTSWGGNWNNLVSSPEFLPLVFQLTYYLSQPPLTAAPSDEVASSQSAIENFPPFESDLTMVTLKTLKKNYPRFNWSFGFTERAAPRNRLKMSRREIDIPILVMIIILMFTEALLTHRVEKSYEHKNLDF